MANYVFFGVNLITFMYIPAQMSTPASSFNAKSLTPDSVSRPSKFQRARMLRAGSSDRLETDDGHNLPYR